MTKAAPSLIRLTTLCKARVSIKNYQQSKLGGNPNQSDDLGDNGIQYHFMPEHNWPNGLVQFNSQLKFSNNETPEIQSVRVCPTDAEATTAAETSTAATTTASQG